MQTLDVLDPRIAGRRAGLFRGLSEPSRLRILHALASGPLTVSEVARRTGLTQPNTSNHLACLLGCGLVERERDGRFAYYRHADDGIATLLSLADRVLSRTDPHAPACPHCGTSL